MADKLFPWQPQQKWSDKDGRTTPEAQRFLDSLFRLVGQFSGTFAGAAERVTIIQGTGAPEGTVVAPVNSQYLDTATKELYIKQDGQGFNGWVKVI